MRKRLLIGLLSAGLVGAMLPGVTSAGAPFGYNVRFVCQGYEYQYAVLFTYDWPPKVRDVLNDPEVAAYLEELEQFADRCVIAGIDPAPDFG